MEGSGVVFRERSDTVGSDRKRMRETGETVPSQLKKPTQKPTFKWIAVLFMGVSEVTI
jgi:hypothetical protein